MNAHLRKSNRRRDQALIRAALLLGSLAAGVLAYLLSGVNLLEASVLPGILFGLLAGGVALHSRARSRQEWSAAWDAYAEREVRRGSFESNQEVGTLSLVGTI
jgi:high-affinity Fe2+/Pb2+ permease